MMLMLAQSLVEPERDVYTEYVTSLGENGKPPTLETYEEVCRELLGDLKRELRRRGLSTAPPRFLGFAEAEWTRDAFDDLVQDLYVFNFVERFRKLRIHSKTKSNIRGLVIRNIRNRLHELQTLADPIGYKVFERLRAALMLLIKKKTLIVLRNPHRTIGKETVLGFGPVNVEVELDDDFETKVRVWNDELLPGIITAPSRLVPGIIERLAEHVVGLRESDVRAFRFHDLVDPMKNDIRRRLQAAEIGADSHTREGGMMIPIVYPDDEPDGAKRFRLLLKCVSDSIERLDQSRERREVWDLWNFVRGHVQDEAADDLWLLSNVQLGQLTGINRKRLPKLFERLGELVRPCRSGLDGRGGA